MVSAPGHTYTLSLSCLPREGETRLAVASCITGMRAAFRPAVAGPTRFAAVLSC